MKVKRQQRKFCLLHKQKRQFSKTSCSIFTTLLITFRTDGTSVRLAPKVQIASKAMNFHSSFRAATISTIPGIKKLARKQKDAKTKGLHTKQNSKHKLLNIHNTHQLWNIRNIRSAPKAQSTSKAMNAHSNVH